MARAPRATIHHDNDDIMNEPMRCSVPARAHAHIVAPIVLIAGAAVGSRRQRAHRRAATQSNGKLLFDDTPNHDRQPAVGRLRELSRVGREPARMQISGNQFGPLSFATAQSRLQSAINSNVGGAMGQFSVLTSTQVSDLAAYIADLPRTSATQLDFAPSAVNTAQNLPIDLTNAVVPSRLAWETRFACWSVFDERHQRVGLHPEQRRLYRDPLGPTAPVG